GDAGRQALHRQLDVVAEVALAVDDHVERLAAAGRDDGGAGYVLLLAQGDELEVRRVLRDLHRVGGTRPEHGAGGTAGDHQLVLAVLGGGEAGGGRGRAGG